MNEYLPSAFYLGQNYPNPFREKTVIKFCIPYRTKIKLEIFDAEGKLIKELLDEEKPAGSYEVELDVTGSHSDKGRNLEEGIYFCQLEAGTGNPESSLPDGKAGSGQVYIETKKMILSK